MNVIKTLFGICVAVLNIDITLFTFTISLFEVLMYGFVVGVLGAFIFKLFD